MPTIQDILQFHFSPITFKQSAQSIIPVTLNALNDHRIDKLQKITEETGANSFKYTGSNMIPQVFRKFKRSVEGTSISFDIRELRTLTYSFSYSELNSPAILSNENELNHAFTLLNSNWRYYFLDGLIDCLLKNWEIKHQSFLAHLEWFITNKLETYTGNRTAFITLKSSKRVLNTKNGDLILGDTLAKLNKPILHATKVLGVPESLLPYPYFSKVIVTYFEKSKSKISDKLDAMDEVLQKHSNFVTNKRLISKAIILLNQPQLATYQDKIKNIAFKQIGDPAETDKWKAFEHATDIERKELAQARNILNNWITQQFINVFFNVCVNDDRRKRFWLRYSSKISSFVVYGPEYTKNLLKLDERISEVVGARFKTVTSNQNIAAFILYIGDHMLIEFSEVGYASLAYKNNSIYKPKLDRQLKSVNDLRNTDMPLAIQTEGYKEYYNEEGRLRHQDGNQIWETRFDNWLNAKVFK